MFWCLEKQKHICVNASLTKLGLNNNKQNTPIDSWHLLILPGSFYENKIKKILPSPGLFLSIISNLLFKDFFCTQVCVKQKHD